jgi:hypothetical protein
VTKLCGKKDVSRLGKLLSGSIAATLLPHRFDEAAVTRLLRLHPSTQPEKVTELAVLMERALASRRSGDWTAIAAQHARVSAENFWGRYRGIGLRGWHPKIEFVGEQRVREALKTGRGAIFWGMRFSSDVVLKQGFYQAGLPLTHLSDAAHGAQESLTTMATSVVSPLFRRAEDRYLAGRILIPDGGGLGYLQTLRDHLRANACVSIFGDSTGRQVVEVPFLHGVGKFATGAPSLAWAEDCALFAPYVIRTGPFEYRVIVDEPIPVDRSLPRKVFVKNAVAEFAHRMELAVEQHPSEWQDWVAWDRSQVRSDPGRVE